MVDVVKRIISRLPNDLQQELKRLRFTTQLRRGAFMTEEPEYARLGEWVTEGDWVIDVGANVGHYSARLSSLVGPFGRVMAFEPVSWTFELLAGVVADLPYQNVTLINVAVSDRVGQVTMTMPPFRTGLANYYQAQVTAKEEIRKGHGAPFHVLAVSIDHLEIPERVSLIKVDVEGHELSALKGMEALLRRDHPVLIVEGREREVEGFLVDLGYGFEETTGSPNRIFAAS